MKLRSIIKSIPNIMTVLRITMIPILVFVFIWMQWNDRARYVVAAIFLFASITDYVDGALARLWKAQSNFGRMLDPIADKMLVISTMLMMSDKKMIPIVPVLVIICREIFVSGMREHLAQMKINIKVNILGKAKTFLQMLAILVLLMAKGRPNIFYGEVALWCATAFTVVSGYIYFIEGVKTFRK